MFKNTSSQKYTVYAWNTSDGTNASGDASNITMKVEQDDDGSRTASNDTNPTETEDGQYVSI